MYSLIHVKKNVCWRYYGKHMTFHALLPNIILLHVISVYMVAFN